MDWTLVPPITASLSRSKPLTGVKRAMLMMLIATVASEAGMCILAVSLQGKLLLTASMGQKVESGSQIFYIDRVLVHQSQRCSFRPLIDDE